MLSLLMMSQDFFGLTNLRCTGTQDLKFIQGCGTHGILFFTVSHRTLKKGLTGHMPGMSTDVR